MIIKKSAQKANQKTPIIRSVVAVLALLIVPPIGLLIMWFGTTWPRIAKVILSVPFLIISFFYTIGFLSAFNPGASFRKGQCMAECLQSYTQERCTKSCATY